MNRDDFYYLNDDHTYRACTCQEWSEQIEKMHKTDTKHVKDEEINGKRISTVWLGLNHSYFGVIPLLFETMVFDENGDDIYCVRHSTWKEAEFGHQIASQWVKDGCKDED